MHRTQIQLPDDLFEKAQRYSQCREMSLAETVRRALELLFQQAPIDVPSGDWKLPVLNLGMKVQAEDLMELMAVDEDDRLRQKVGLTPRDHGWG